MIKIFDYGAGNMLSLYRAFEYLNLEFLVKKDFNNLKKEDILVIPGVGNFKEASRRIESNNLDTFNLKEPKERPFIIGICLGMQLLLSTGQESGNSKGLNLVKGDVIKIPQKTKSGESINKTLIGWETLQLKKNIGKDFKFLEKFEQESFYHVHAYMCDVEDQSNLLSTYPKHLSFIPNIIGSADQKLIGFQFHPEKSGTIGLKLIAETLQFADAINKKFL